MKKSSWKISNKLVLLSIVIIGFFLTIIGLVYSSFSLIEPVKSINFTSSKLSYDKKDPGSFKVEKSAKWVENGKSQITFDIDTVSKQKYQYTDVILVMDISISMSESNKLETAKEDALELVDQVYSTTGNRMAFICFNDTAEIYTNFTDKIEQLKNGIQSVNFKGRSNYYQAFVSIEKVLKSYQIEENRDCVVLFLTGSYPSIDTPNEVGYFNYLKEQYPFIKVNAVQYGMSEEVIEPIKKVSDNQYVVSSSEKENKLLEVYKTSEEYSKFILTDYIDTNYFSVESIDDIVVSQGEVDFNKEEQKVIWTIDNLKSGSKLKMTIDANLKKDYVGKSGIYSTNSREEVESSIDGIEEFITSVETPKISSTYNVTYDGNVPPGCSVKNIPASESHFVLDKVLINRESLECEGYYFSGWKVMGFDAIQMNNDYFIMPENDVILRAEWRKLLLTKSMSGEVYSVPTAKMQVALNPDTGAQEIWKYKDSVTKVIFQNKIEDIYNTKESFDLSEENNFSIMGRVVPNVEDSSTYTIYIQGDNGIIANENSSYLFNQFQRLESIEGIEYFDTSNVTDMSYMFGWCESLKSLNLQTFNTSKVTTMANMFRDTRELKNLDLSSFRTSKVMDMSAMFEGTGIVHLDLSTFDTSNVLTMSVMFNNANYLETLDVSSFNTENVIDMSNMFGYCYVLSSLDLSNFRTPNVTTMKETFINCMNLTKLDLSSFNTSKVRDMYAIFYGCEKLVDLDISSFDTSNVEYLGGMFNRCSSLESLDLRHFDTKKAVSMDWMFCACTSLINLDISSFDTSNVINMAGMFNMCSKFTSLDLSHFKTSSVINMSQMFGGCSGLAGLDVSSFNTSSVIYMSQMFGGCSGLVGLDLSNFNTSNVIDMSQMFSGCSSLAGLDLGSFNTSSVIGMSQMFAYCGSLTKLDLSNFNTSNVIDMSQMFAYCGSLIDLNISSFNTENVQDMYAMFGLCQNLTKLDVRNFNTSNVVNMGAMFYYCDHLSDIDLSNFDTSKVTNANSMFYFCLNINTTINLSFQSTVDYAEMFYGSSYSSGKVIVNYSSDLSGIIDSIIATKQEAQCNVVKGELIV